MAVHLPDENYILYDENANMTEIVSNEFFRRTMLTEWFECNKKFPEARSLTYLEFTSKWCWLKDKRVWEPRRSGFKIGRLYYVHPSVGERYYLRMLLMIVKGTQDYEQLRTYNGKLYHTFKEACNARGLLGNDQEWYDAFNEAAAWGTSSQLRQLFVTMLLFCDVKDEYAFFEKVWRVLADDIQFQIRESIGNPRFYIPDNSPKDLLLDDLATLFSKNGGRITDHNLPKKAGTIKHTTGNRLIEEELSYNTSELLLEAESDMSSLNDEQLSEFYTITALQHIDLILADTQVCAYPTNFTKHHALFSTLFLFL